MTEMTVFFIAQSVIIVGAILTAYIRTQVAIARLQIIVGNVEMTTTSLKGDHRHLAGQVGGISRGLSRLEGYVNANKAGNHSEP